jgi:hypothetical protein
MRGNSILTVAVMGLFLAGCTVKRDDVIGKYHLNNAPRISATLEIRQDGTYIQRIVPEGQASTLHEGKWTFVRQSDNPLLLFNAYSIECHSTCELVANQGISFPIDGYSRWLVLSVDADAGIGYMKD